MLKFYLLGTMYRIFFALSVNTAKECFLPAFINDTCALCTKENHIT